MNYTYGLKQRGQTLVETMFVLAVLALIIAVAGKFYSSTRFNANVNNTVQDVNYILGATANYSLGNTPVDTSSFSTPLFAAIQGAGFLPTGMNASSPFGGTYEVYTAKGGFTEVQITGIPLQGCLAICNVMRTNLAQLASCVADSTYQAPAIGDALFTGSSSSTGVCKLQFSATALAPT